MRPVFSSTPGDTRVIPPTDGFAMFRGLLVDRTRSTGLGLKLILEGETPGDWGDPASSASHTNAMNDITTQNDGDLQSLHDESATSTEYRNLVEEVM